MEVAGADGSLRDFEWRDFLGFYVNDPILILDWSGDLKKPAAGHAHSLPLEHVGGNDDVGDACLIFKREKNKSLGRAGPCQTACGGKFLIGRVFNKIQEFADPLHAFAGVRQGAGCFCKFRGAVMPFGLAANVR
jgi:hypothetical protein